VVRTPGGVRFEIDVLWRPVRPLVPSGRACLPPGAGRDDPPLPGRPPQSGHGERGRVDESVAIR
jgi:hypothetical protein